MEFNDKQTEIMVNIMGTADGIKTVAEDQQLDDRLHEGNYKKRMDSRMEIIRREAQRIEDMTCDLGDSENNDDD